MSRNKRGKTPRKITTKPVVSHKKIDRKEQLQKQRESMPDVFEEFEELPSKVKSVIETFPLEEQGKVVELVLEVTRITAFSGPIPPPAILQGYEDVIEGGAERILAMAEKQSKHRQEIEKEVITKQLGQSSRGQIFGFLLALIGFGLGTLLAAWGNTGLAGILFTTTIIGLVSIFVIGKRAKNSSPKSKDNSNSNEEEEDDD